MKKVFVFITILALSLNMVSPAFATVETADDAPITLQSSSVQYSLVASAMASLGLSFCLSASGITFGSDEATQAINGIYVDLVEATADWDWDFINALSNIGTLIAMGYSFGVDDIEYFDEIVDTIKDYTGTTIFGDADYTASDATGSYVIYTPTGTYDWVSMASGFDTISVSSLTSTASSSGMTLLYNSLSNPIFYGINSMYFFFADGDAIGSDLYGTWDFSSAVQGSIYSYGNDVFGLGSEQNNLGWAVMNSTPGVFFLSGDMALAYSSENNTTVYAITSASTIEYNYTSSSTGAVNFYLTGLSCYSKGKLVSEGVKIQGNFGTSFTAQEVQTETNVYTTYASADNITTDISTGAVAVQGGTSLDDDDAISAIISIMTPALIQELISTGLLAETLAQALGETSTDTDTDTGTGESYSGILSNIYEFLVSIPTTIVTGIGTAIDTAVTTISGFLQGIASTGVSIYEFIVTLPQAISTAIGDMFTVAETAFATAIAEPYEYVIGKFAVFEVIYDYCIGVFDEIFIDDPEPPVIWVDFSNSNSDVIQYYGMVKVLDLSWYAEYKPYGDMIVAGILWVFFLWRLFSRIPDIIRGAGMQMHGQAKFEGRRSNSDN